MSSVWLPIKDGDLRAFALYQRHYSYKPRPTTQLGKPNGTRIMGPAARIILLTAEADALFGWMFPLAGTRRDHQEGVNCTIFRNESPHRSSDMILEADEIAWARWPDVRHWTYVDPSRISSANPGYCFKRAGYKFCGTSKKGLHILEKFSE